MCCVVAVLNLHKNEQYSCCNLCSCASKELKLDGKYRAYNFSMDVSLGPASQSTVTTTTTCTPPDLMTSSSTSNLPGEAFITTSILYAKVGNLADFVAPTMQYALAALLLYGLWKIGRFIFLMVFPFGYPQPLLQASAPGAHAPPPSARNYMFRLGRFQAPQVVLVGIYLSLAREFLSYFQIESLPISLCVSYHSMIEIVSLV